MPKVGPLLLLVAAVVAVVPGTAAATSCIAPPAPRETVTGDGDMAMGGTFFEHWDGAVLGQVVAVERHDRGPGGTKITVDTYGVIGTDTAAQTMVLSADDPGEMNGYAFQTGSSYLIPVQTTGPQGQVNYSFVCDPIGEIAGPDEARELLAAARANDVATAVPGNGAEAQPDAGRDGGNASRPASAPPWLWGAAGALAVALLLASALTFRRRHPA